MSGQRESLKMIILFQCLLVIVLSVSGSWALSDEEIARLQSEVQAWPAGERIAYWAERFVGTAYDTDPRGAYVTGSVIVSDEKIDCMYHVFRSVELAMSRTPEEAIEIALDRRFHSKGVIDKGRVVNYHDRFAYGEDMLSSGKWGKMVIPVTGTGDITVEGNTVAFASPAVLLKGLDTLRSGDIIFFAKAPSKRKSGEIVGHMGIIKVEGPPQAPGLQRVFLIHAQGLKTAGGSVKKVFLRDYMAHMPFVGVQVRRMD